MTWAALAGLAAGGVHVLSGPDHLAAVAPAACDAPSRAARVGAAWGVGHGVGVVAAALIARLVGALLPIERLSEGAETLVGLVLIALGVRTLWQARAAPRAHAAAQREVFSMGALHGAAGAHHVLLAMPALVLDLPGALWYLAAYVVAAALTMSVTGAFLGAGLRRAGAASARRLHTAAGALALGVGLYWVGA